MILNRKSNTLTLEEIHRYMHMEGACLHLGNPRLACTWLRGGLECILARAALEEPDRGHKWNEQRDELNATIAARFPDRITTIQEESECRLAWSEVDTATGLDTHEYIHYILATPLMPPYRV
jgi:hypothetical protein